jgi:hypothetical protein
LSIFRIDTKSVLKWEYQAIILGLIAIIAGTLPAWLAGQSVAASFYSSRFALASMFGAALLIIGLLEWLTPRHLVKITLVAAMVFISTNYHIRISDQYKSSWDAQKRFYWQLYWRAPAIEPNTPFISDNEILHYAGGYATALGLNLTYGQGTKPDDLAYWLFNLDDKLEGQMRRFNERKALQAKLRTLHFSGKSYNSLIIDHGNDFCLKIIEEGRAENTLLPAQFAELLPVANLGRIQLSQERSLPEKSIFGSEPERNWCYYYEKADLARQMGNWGAITHLGDMALSAGYVPLDPIEWFVFIEGYGLTGNVDQATSLTRRVFETREDYGPALCELWKGMANQQPENSGLLSEWEILRGSPLCLAE